jgi:hypothetical protein
MNITKNVFYLLKIHNAEGAADGELGAIEEGEGVIAVEEGLKATGDGFAASRPSATSNKRIQLELSIFRKLSNIPNRDR